MCNDIGEASYIDSLVAAALLQTINSLPGRKQYVRKINERYKLKMEGALCAGQFFGAARCCVADAAC